jgi:hypothetical protein
MKDFIVWTPSRVLETVFQVFLSLTNSYKHLQCACIDLVTKAGCRPGFEEPAGGGGVYGDNIIF